MLFSEIPGLEETKSKLISAVKNNHVAHAQLFAGHIGSANLALALAFSTYISCEERQPEDSCGRCFSCVKYNKIIHPDLHFVLPVATTKSVPKDPQSTLFLKDWRKFVLENKYGDVNDWGSFIGAENKQLSISVEEARNIIKTISLKSFESEYKVLIIWLPEMMHPSASNAILKVLEEPPLKTIFILVTNNAERILPTILSRTQRVNIPQFEDEEISSELIKVYNAEPKRAAQIAYIADGNLNDGIRLLKETEDDTHEMFRGWMRICYKKNNINDLIVFSDDFSKIGREAQKSLLLYGLGIMRECLVFTYAKELSRLKNEEYDFVDKFSKSITEDKAQKVSSVIGEALYHIERNGNAKITILDTSFNISSVLKS